MRRRQTDDPLAGVPPELREFRAATWLPLVAPDPTPEHWPESLRHEHAAAKEWVQARRRWAAVHGYPADPLRWLRDHHDVPAAVRRRARQLVDEDDVTAGDEAAEPEAPITS